MAQENKYKLKFDKVVEVLRPDPSSVEDKFIVIRGLIGKSNKKGHIRVFLDQSLNFFIDVSENEILYVSELSKEESSIGGSVIWFNINTLYTYGDPSQKNRPQESFLNGNLKRFVRDRNFRARPSSRGNPFAFPGFFVLDDPSGFDPKCPVEPTIWDVTPCQSCPTDTCNPIPASLPPEYSDWRKRFNPKTGLEKFNPYEWWW